MAAASAVSLPLFRQYISTTPIPLILCTSPAAHIIDRAASCRAVLNQNVTSLVVVSLSIVFGVMTHGIIPG